MTVFGAPVNQDSDGVRTAARLGDRGDSTNEWFQTQRTFNGGDVAQGNTTDVAVTAVDATAGTVISLLKGVISRLNALLGIGAASLLKLEDAVAASGDAGVMALAVRRDTATADGAAGDYVPLHTDSTGRLRVVDVLTAPTNATTTVLAASLVVKSAAGVLYGLQGYSTAAQFIQIYNATTLPANGVAPVITFPVEADKPFSIDFGKLGRAFATGIVVGNSSTGPTKTIGGSTIWVDAQFI